MLAAVLIGSNCRLPFGPELPSGLSLKVEDTAEGRFSFSIGIEGLSPYPCFI